LIEEEVPPEADLMESMRAIGYSLKTAVADLCDNSIAAGASSIHLAWAIDGGPFVYLLDDGSGMSREGVRVAMRLAGKSPLAQRDASDLGRFGLGLKTASMSQARSLTVVTKQGRHIFAAEWDLDHLRSVGKWVMRWLEPEDYEALPGFAGLTTQTTGTLVVWRKLDQLIDDLESAEKALSGRFEEVAAHLGLVFHRFLGAKANRLRIAVNGSPVPTFDPFLEGEISVIDRGITSVHVGAGIVNVQPFILPNLNSMTRSQRDKAIFDELKMREAQGFYVYRNKRLLAWGTWFRVAPMDESGRLARVRVDTDNTLDAQWKLGIMKSTVQPPKVLLDALKRLVPNILENSSRVVRAKPAVQTNSDGNLWKIKQVAEDAFALQVNSEHQLVLAISDRLAPREQRSLSILLDALARYIPAEDLHNLLARDGAVQTGFQTDEEIWSFGQVLFEQIQAMAIGDIEKVWSLVEQVEPFASDTQLRSKLRALRQEGKS
jgi:hypothetical protein